MAYKICGDFGNVAAKAATQNNDVVIRNAAVQYDGQDDELYSLGLFAGDGAGSDQRSEVGESVRIALDDTEWIVGEAAYRVAVKSRQKTTYSRYGTEEWRALVAATFAALYPNRSDTIELTYNIPVALIRQKFHYELNEIFAGNWNVFYQGRDLNFFVDPDTISMVPEGFGSLCYMCLKESGRDFLDRELAGSRVVVFDFGGFTLDIMTFDALSIGSYNESVTSGIIDVRNAVSRAIKRRWQRSEIPSHVLNEIIRTKQYQHKNETFDVSGIVDDALVDLMDDALRVWNEDLGGGVDYQAVIISGGGGPIIGPLLAAQLDHDIRIIPEGEAHRANALGMMRYERFRKIQAQH